MSQSVRDFERTFLAAADYSAKQFYIVKLDTADNTVILAGAGDRGIGVMQNTPGSGQGATVRFLGTSLVTAGAAITKGSYVKSDASGKAVATTTDRDDAIGYALEAAGADGDVIEIMLTPGLERSTA